MSDLIQKIKNLFNKAKTPKISYVRAGVRPLRDWRIMLSAVFICLFVTAAFAFYFYTQIDNGSLFSSPASDVVGGPKINPTLLKKIVDDSIARESSRLEIQNSKPIPSDPSL